MNLTHKKYGYVSINIEILKNNVGKNSIMEIINDYSTASFQMIESPAYFESYVHVLRSMQSMDSWERLPFEELIVNGDNAYGRMPPYMA